MAYGDIFKTNHRSVQCICPRCKKDHTLKLFWTGSLPAYKYCLFCRQIAKRAYMVETYSVSHEIMGAANATF